MCPPSRLQCGFVRNMSIRRIDHDFVSISRVVILDRQQSSPDHNFQFQWLGQSLLACTVMQFPTGMKLLYSNTLDQFRPEPSSAESVYNNNGYSQVCILLWLNNFYQLSFDRCPILDRHLSVSMYHAVLVLLTIVSKCMHQLVI